MRVQVVNFGSQWTHRIGRTLKYQGCDAEIIDVSTPVNDIAADGLVLSGGAIRIGSGGEDDVGHAHEYLDELEIPILGICAGQQFIAMHFGGKCEPSENPEYGQVEIIVEQEDDLFRNIPKRFNAWASHNDEVTHYPGFELLARSGKGVNHAIKHMKRPIYGTLFHPEVEHTEHGSEILGNFLQVCAKRITNK